MNTTLRIQGNLLIILLIISILFCPVMPIMSLSYAIPISLIVCVLYYGKILKCIKNWVVIFLATVVIATVCSFFFKQNYVFYGLDYINVQRMDIKYCVNIVFAILIYFSTKVLIDESTLANKCINKLTLLTITFIYLGFILFMCSPPLFYAIKNTLFQGNVSVQISEYLSAGLYQRYTYIFLDPNNGGYFCLMILIYYVESRRMKNQSTTLLYILILCVPIMTFSTGNLYCVIIYFILCLFCRLRKPISAPKIKLPVLIISAIFIVGVLLIVMFWDQVSGLPIVSTITQSYDSAVTRMKGNSIDSRLDNYVEIFQSVPPIIGNGYTLLINGAYFRPHNDHIRVLFGYGIVAYIALIAAFVQRKLLKRKYFFMLPVLIASLINSVIDEPRFLFAFALYFAFTNACEDRNSRRDASDEHFDYCK